MGGNGTGDRGDATAGSVASTSWTRWADAAARWAMATIQPSMRSGHTNRTT